MGVHVGLAVLPYLVSNRDWERVYEETLVLLAAWPEPPVGLTKRTVAGETVAVFTRDYQRAESWRILADARTLLRGETFEFPRRLACSGEHRTARGAEDPEEDVLVRFIKSKENGRRCCEVFGNKTRGRPYHALITAVATLVENRLPTAAMAHADVSLEDGRAACEALQNIFGERFSLPVLLDEPRLRARASPHFSASIIGDFIRGYGPVPTNGAVADFLGMLLRHSPNHRLLEALERDPRTYNSERELPDELRAFIAGITRQLAKHARGMELHGRLDRSGVARSRLLAGIAKRTRWNGIVLTESAWNEVERAPPHELLFVLRLVHLQYREELDRFIQVLFENRALREFAYRQWRACQSEDLPSKLEPRR